MSLKQLRRKIYRETITKRLSSEFLFSLNRCVLISSHGFAAFAHGHHRFDQDVDFSHFWDKTYSCFYVRTDDVEEFVAKIGQRPLNQKHVVTLLVGDSDTPVSGKKRELLERLAQEHGPLQIFCQNLADNSVSLKNLPIGLDYHSNLYFYDFFQPNRKMPLHQELALVDLLKSAQNWSSRPLRVSVDWAGSTHRGDRSEALEHLPGQLCQFTDFGGKKRVAQMDIWKQHLSCQFVASPFGVGLDCHRTWEAIALGCVPITCRSGLASSFAGLPVLELESWSELTEEKLQQAAKKISGEKFDFGPMFMSHWKKHFAQDVQNHDRHLASVDDWPRVFRAEFDRIRWDCA